MAFSTSVGIVCFLFSVVLPFIGAQLLQYPSVLPESCASSSLSYFSTANQQCVSCWPGAEPTADFLFCQCLAGYQRSVPSVQPFNCTQCASLQTTLDGRDCTTCSASAAEGSCTCPTAQEAVVDRYSNGTVLPTSECQTCATGSGPTGTTGGCASCDTCGCAIVSDDVCLPSTPALPAAIDATAQPSVFIQQKVRAAFVGCFLDSNTGGHSNITACQALANMCVMETYRIPVVAGDTACSLYGQTLSSTGIINGNIAWTANRPWLYYDDYNRLSQPGTFTSSTVASEVLTETEITTAFNIKGGTSVLDIVVFSYDENGNFLGRQAATTGVLQLCPDRPSVKSAAFTFGTTYSRSCSLSLTDLSNSALYPQRFYELNLEFTDASGVLQLYPIPVLITNYRSPDNNQPVNEAAANTRWVLVRRFYLIDNLSGITTALGDSPTTVTYATTMTLNIELQPSSSGLIYPPYLSVTYATDDVPVAGAADVQITTDFQVTYSSNMASQEQGIMISLIVFGVLAGVYALFETSTWRRRMGLQYIDLSSLGMFLYFSMCNLANAFFVVMVGYASVTLLFYKGQSLVTTTLPEGTVLQNFQIFIIVAFVFKAVEILGMIFIQATVDIFLVDWERPKVKDSEGKVSIWRTYFIANEWNEIQTCRKVSFFLQLMAVLLFLEVVGFKDLALENTSTSVGGTTTTSSDAYVPPSNSVLRFALSSLIFLVVDVVQVIYVVAIHERFISDRIREFIDLCSVSNVSVFILSHTNYGYYIHGRSVYGKADTDMMDMNKMLQKEADNLTAARGLEAGRDEQTFQVAIPLSFRMQYDKIYNVLEAAKHQPTARGVNVSDAKMTESVQAYRKMKEFMTAFLDHSVHGLDYFVKDKMLLEKLFDVEMQDPTNSGAFFYNDTSNSFTNVLFYGREFALLTFDILLFGIIDLGTQDFVLATILTYIIGKFLAIVRQSIGRHNLAKKTLVDKRFLI
uniref:Meckelin-like n=1 Tax=Phallusia mammillata TaxID=59560 RepID=A0A6F9DVS3_9ASCI|nr:meckelin-like [Phallusia mammillata]